MLEAVGLCKRFGALDATHNVSLRLEAGARHAIIGPNGAGKTTLFNLLAGEIRPVQNGEERLIEAAKHGFKRAIIPEANRPRKSSKLDIEVLAVGRLDQALALI